MQYIKEKAGHVPQARARAEGSPFDTPTRAEALLAFYVHRTQRETSSPMRIEPVTFNKPQPKTLVGKRRSVEEW